MPRANLCSLWTLHALLAVFLFMLAPGEAMACGGNGERACCITDGGNACGGGLIQTGNCVGELGGDACTCGGFNPFGLTKAVGVCRAPTCGGNGQRGCCVGAERDVKGLSNPTRPCTGAGIEVGNCVARLGANNCHCLTGFDSSGVCVVPTGCGGNGARACCAVERPGDPCNDGTVEVGGCADGRDDCLCAPAVWAHGRCVDPGCGGHGERGCCLLGEERATQGLVGPCEAGLVEYGACQGDCACKGGVGGSSSGRCYRPTACGGEGQRACCVGEGAACQAGLVESGSPLAEFFGISSDCESELGGPGCLCASGLLSAGICTRPHCGGQGERGCCVGAERQQRGFAGPCEAGLREDVVGGCQGDCTCSGGVGASIGTCRRETPCGGADQRACCIGFGEFAANPQQTPSCTGNLIEVPSCNGDGCICGGAGFGQRSTGMCRANSAPTPCGGPNERACCAGTFEVLVGMACDAGMVELPGCSGEGCLCGGWNPLGVQASGICAQPTACGGAGQRACCTPFLETAPNGLACGAGLTPILGCSGDCFCGGIATGQESLETCAVANPGLGTMAEPTTGWTPPAGAPHACGLRGYADMHLHLFADTAHGGGVLAGKSWDPAGVNVALQQDFGTNAPLVSKSGAALPAPNCPPHLPNCGAKVFHQDHIIGQDTVGFSSGDGSNSNLGAPLFNGWPRWSNVTHQQAYYKWLERAWRGGMRMTSMLAVSNEAMCGGNSRMPGVDCTDSMPAIDEQIDAAYRFEDWLDGQSGGAGRGWFRIVTTPAAARQVMSEGKLAVILGIEVDNLFGCKADRPNSAECNYNRMLDELHRYYAMGVRHIFPVHNFNNGYGGTATWMDAVNVGNNYSEGHYYTAEECAPEGYGFRLSSFLAGAVNLAGFGGMALPNLFPPYEAYTATCNVRSLTGLGTELLDEMMDLGMLIDVDHMGRKALDQALDMAEAYRFQPDFNLPRCNFDFECGDSMVCCRFGSRSQSCQPSVDDCDPQGYPLIASHVLMFDLYQQAARTERMRTLEQLQRIAALRGMIAPITEMRDANDDGARVSTQYGAVANDCLKSTKTFAQVLQYAVDVMGAPVGIGTDFNGIAFHLSPRFGSDACAGNAADRSDQYRRGQRVAYPFTLDTFGSFAKQVSGLKTFDYNVDGLAHVGLLPDFVKDLETVGLPTETLEQFWRSAQGFVEVWERAEGTSTALPPLSCFQLDLDADAQCQVSEAALKRAMAPDARYVVTDIFPRGPYAAPFNDTVSATIAGNDACVEGGPGQPNGGRICSPNLYITDRKGPEITCPADVIAPYTNSFGNGFTQVQLPAMTAVDNCDGQMAQGSVGCNYQRDAVLPIGTVTVDCGVQDRAQNRSTCSYRVTVQKLGPRLQLPPNVTVECLQPTTPNVTGTAVATPWYGAATLTHADVFEPGCGGSGRILRTWTARQNDNPAISTSGTQVITIADSTPPTIDAPPDVDRRADQDSSPAGTGLPVAADLCDDVAAPRFADAVENFADGSRVITRTWTVADACGLEASDVQRIAIAPDLCPLDQNKVAPGQCGCGVADLDSDGDTVADCLDGCPNDPNKIARLVTGCPCGVFDTDTDADGTPDCHDGCPNHAPKTAPGVCGCAAADTDADGDGSLNCNDLCPDDRAKTLPGICGCGLDDARVACPAGSTLYGAHVGGFCCTGFTNGDFCVGEICAVDPARSQGQPLCPRSVCEPCPANGAGGLDADRDGVPDCRDLCPVDAGKVEPGVCGCATADTDSDGDATPNCNDRCPDDPGKLAPGVCGCGTADTDADSDGTPNCNDPCPNDRNKVPPGICGCGTPDIDSDGDGTANCDDPCPNHAEKPEPGLCGCATADTDSDADDTPDCNDLCPFDAAKVAPGRCGCSNPEDPNGCPPGGVLYGQAVGGFCCFGDVINDGANCTGALCARDPARAQGNPVCIENICEPCPANGQGVDVDRDGTPDCRDLCPQHAGKVDPGVCGCAVADTDSDRDDTPDCNDLCPNDAGKTAAGQCGCAVADTDSDRDETPDCDDLCPNDAEKVAEGPCGCGAVDDDSDGDGTPDCDDLCPDDVGKVEPLHCGCSLAETDSDRDETLDCDDLCPDDAGKTEPGLCGCAAADLDTDADGTMDCNDLCPINPERTAPGRCGCALPDDDGDPDFDGVCDGIDNCPDVSNPGQADRDRDGEGDACDDDPVLPPDAGVLSPDAGASPEDAGVLPEDARVLPEDARILPRDAAVLPADARAVPSDAGMLPADAGPQPADLGDPRADAGRQPLNDARLAGDGMGPSPDAGGPTADGAGKPEDAAVATADAAGAQADAGGSSADARVGGDAAMAGGGGGGGGAGRGGSGGAADGEDEVDGGFSGTGEDGEGDGGPSSDGGEGAGGCGCDLSGGRNPRPWAVLLALLAATRLRRRRRA